MNDPATQPLNDPATQPLVAVAFSAVHPHATAPARQHHDDAGYDLTTTTAITLAPSARALVPTGIAIALPPGYAGFVMPRSGLAVRHGVTVLNAPGVIDAGYRGEVQVPLVNTDSQHDVTIAVGDRIAQLVVMPVPAVRFEQREHLDQTSRSTAGFGSTGGVSATMRADTGGNR